MPKLGLIALGVALTACDVIGEADRIRPTEELHFTNKVVLLEEFTGHKCVNCPAASEEAARLEAWCEGHLLVVGIHAGSYANTSGSAWKDDFRTGAGEAYNAYFRPEGYPAAMIDRKTTGSKVTHDNLSSWSALVINSLAETAPVEIGLEATVQPKEKEEDAHDTKRMEKLDVSLLFPQSRTGKLAVQVWLVEDSVRAPQLLPDNSIAWEYLHRHVLRDAVNGTWGEEIGTAFSEGQVWKKTYSYTLAVGWNPARCRFVAFVYETETREILQAAQVAVAD